MEMPAKEENPRGFGSSAPRPCCQGRTWSKHIREPRSAARPSPSTTVPTQASSTASTASPSQTPMHILDSTYDSEDPDVHNQLLNEQERLSQALEKAHHEVARLRREADEHQEEVTRWKEQTQHWQMQARDFKEALHQERNSHDSFLARLKRSWHDVFGPSVPSSEQPPVLFAFSTQTGIANKFTPIVYHIVEAALGISDAHASGVLAPFTAATAQSCPNAPLLYVLQLSTSRLDEACSEYVDEHLLRQEAQSGRVVVLVVLRPGTQVASVQPHTATGDGPGQRGYEVLEFNIETDFSRNTRALCAHGNLSALSLPRLHDALLPSYRQWAGTRSVWSVLFGGQSGS